MRRASFLLIFLFTFVLFGCDGEEVRRAVIETKSGAVHAFELELALTPEEQQKGLMFRTKLPENAGMLFFHRVCVPASFWMKNTLLPLDMIFIAADGRIVRIAEMTEPETLDIHVSGEPVNGILEINGGLSQRLGIGEGDYLRHPWFGPGGEATCG
ncbi:DUF192 domain-containing protein [Parvibaculum sp.]|uniref:DUF192 domain-containing protein n=1 Tax=Parvibaculum sp. TaxID=2024848 RepID=UPI003C717EB7